MMKTFLKVSLFTSSLLLFSCGESDDTEYTEKQEKYEVEHDYDEVLAEAQELEKRVLKENPPSDSLLKAAITKFQSFANLWPEDPESPNYLFKASDYAIMVDQPVKSVHILERILEDYPDYDKTEDVMYLRADHLDWELRDTTKAKEAYQEYIDKYPDSPRAKDAEIRIEYIHLNLEEYANKIISEYEEQSTN